MSIKFKETNYGALLTRSKEPQYIAKLYRFSGGQSLPLYPFPSDEFPAKALLVKPCLCTVIFSLHQENGSGNIEKNRWIHVIANGHEGFLNGLDHLTPVNEYFRYEAWPGNNVFLCRGNVMLGPDFRFFLFTNALLFVPFSIFAWRYQYFPLKEMSSYQSMNLSLLQILTTLCFFYTVLNLWQCNLTGTPISSKYNLKINCRTRYST